MSDLEQRSQDSSVLSTTSRSDSTSQFPKLPSSVIANPL